MNALLSIRWVRELVLALPLALLLIVFLIVPLMSTLWSSFGGSDLTLDHYRRVFTDPNNFSVLQSTLSVGAMVTIFSLLLGYPVAYLMTRLGPSALAVVAMFLLVPLFTAFLIRTYSWILILGRQGVVNNALIWLGLTDGPLELLNTTFAVVVGMVHVFTPMAVMTMYSAMVRVDHSLSTAAQILGATPTQAFVRVYFPLTLPGVLAAGVLIFIVSLGFYITPALLGGPANTMISQLIVTQMTTLLNFELGFASSIVLLLITAAILGLASLFIPLEVIWSSAAEQRAPGRSYLLKRAADGVGRLFSPVLTTAETLLHRLTRPLITQRGVWLWAFTVAILLFLTAPLIVVVFLSFSSSSFVVFPPPGYSLRWWQELALANDWHSAFLASLQLGAVVAVVSTVIGTMGATWLVRTRLPIKRALFLLSLSPLIVPVIIISVSLYVFEARIGLLGRFAGLVIGHVLLATPYVVVVMSAALRNLDPSLEPAAAIHGARPMQALRMVVLPILRPALLTGGLLAFLTSFDELLVTIFLLGRQTQTIPLKFWGDIRFQIDPLLSAASTLIVLLVIVSIGLAQWSRIRALRRGARPEQR